MTSDTQNKLCSKCMKNFSVAKCHGCEESFCTKHFIKHRLYLAEQMVDINKKHEILQQDLNHADFEYPLISSIYAWERKSMRKIQEIADKARNDIQKWLDKTKTDVKNSLEQITEQLKSSEKFDNYTELDIEKWTNQLEELRNLLEKPSTISVVENEKSSSTIRTIKVIDKQISYACSDQLERGKSLSIKYTDMDQERFVKMFGPCKISEDDHVVTHSSYRAGLSQINGKTSYSSGKHLIHFLIENKGDKNIFIGIISASHKVISPTFDYSVHGWWNLDYSIINGESKGADTEDFIKSGDKLTLTIDCDNQQLELEHYRTKKIANLPIKVEVCPFPWKILIRLLSATDSIRILS